MDYLLDTWIFHSVKLNEFSCAHPQNVVLVSPPPLPDKENSNRGGSAAGGHMALDRKISTSSTASMGHGGSGSVDKLKIIDFGLARELGKQAYNWNHEESPAWPRLKRKGSFTNPYRDFESNRD